MAFKIPFGIETSKFKSGLKDMQASVNEFGTKVEKDLQGSNKGFFKMAGNIGLVTAGLGVLGGIAIAAFSKVSQKVKKLENQSAEAATGVEELQVVLQEAFKAGTQSEQVVAAFKNIASRSVDAVNGAENYQQAMKRLNIDFKTFVSLPGERKLEEVGKGFVNAEDEAQAYRDVLLLLGEDAGPKMIKTLEKLGTEGFDTLNAKMRESGQIIQDDVVAGLKDAQAAIDDLSNKAATKGTQVAGFVANLFGSGDDASVDIARAQLQDRAAAIASLGFSTLFKSEEDRAIERQERVRVDLQGTDGSEAAANIAKFKKRIQNEKDDKAGVARGLQGDNPFGQSRKELDDIAKAKDPFKSAFSAFGDAGAKDPFAEEVKKGSSGFQGVPVDSLQAIGGGGRGVASSNTMMNKQRNTLLQQIAENTASTTDGAGNSNGSTLG